jgi:uncharacterized membrane protein
MATSRNATRAYRNLKNHRTLGERSADLMTRTIGSWSFLIGLSIFLVSWIIINFYGIFIRQWDPYPFILLNLVLSFLAAYQAPIILMSQNREAQIDRKRFEYDYKIDKKAEREIQDIQKDLEEIKKLLKRRKKR